jgi:DNA-binding CsgD family transcriptional regulator
MSGDNENGKESPPVSVREKYSKKLLEFALRMKPGSEDFEKEVLLALDELFSFDRTVFLHIGEDGSFGECVGHRMGGQGFRLFGGMDARDDFFAPVNQKQHRRVCSIRDVMSYEEYERTEHHETLRLCKVYYQAAAYMNCGDKTSAAISFFRQKEDGEFAQEELELISELSLLVEKHLNTHSRIVTAERNQFERQIYYQILHNMNCGVILCDGAFHAQHVSERVSDLLPDSFRKFTNKDYSIWIQGHLAPFRDWRDSKPFTLPELPRLRISLHTLQLPSVRQSNHIVNVVVFTHIGQEMRQTRYGLTQREMQVCDLLREGKNTGDIAAALHISENTCKRHLENIYKKFGVSRRKDLMDLLNLLFRT